MESKKQLKFMTFNLRVDVTEDGINSFTNRFHRVLDVIRDENPDVIGFQEVTSAMREALRENLREYTLQGCGRDKNYHGEAMVIAYRTKDFELISLENIWLSPTPRVPGSVFGGDQSKYPRMLTSALLKHSEISEPFNFINTHLDHQGTQARYLGAMETVQIISGYSEKFVLTGDFNALPESSEIKLITSALAYRGAFDCSADLGGTYHAFGKLAENPKKIDYIFTDAECERSYIVEDTKVNG